MDHAESIAAAATAIATHTRAAGLDDDGDPAGIGMWHLVSSLDRIAGEEGFDVGETLTEARAGRERLYLVVQVNKPLNMTVTYVDEPVEFEVKARDLTEACRKVLERKPGRRPDIAIRGTRKPYTGDYIKPDAARYAATARILEGDVASVTKAVSRDALARKSAQPAVGMPAPEAGGADLGMEDAGHLALKPFTVDGMKTRDSVRAAFAALLDHAEASGESVESTLADVISERPFIGLR